MNYTRIEYFLALCQYKSFSETARQLYVSQATISKQIAALEDDLGFKLFERSSNHLSLTTQGEIMNAAYSEAQNTIETAKREALNYSKNISDSVKISVLESAEIVANCERPFCEVLDKLKKEIDISVEFSPYQKMNSQLRNNNIDIGITLLEEAQGYPTLKYTKLCDLPMGLLYHKDLEIVKDGELDIDLIRSQPFYFVGEGSMGVDKYLKNQKVRLGIPPENYRIVPNIASIITNAELKQGVAIVASTPKIRSNPNLEFYPLEELSTTIVAVWNKENNNNSRSLITKRIRRLIIESGL